MSSSGCKKKQRERYYLERVKERYNDFPSGETVPYEEPDFLFKHSTITIGIELVDYVRGQSHSGSKSRQLETLHEQIVQLAKDDFEKSNNIPLQVHFLWGTHPPINRDASKGIAENISLFIKKYIPQKVFDNIRLTYDDLEIFQLDSYFACISIFRLKPSSKSVWANTNAGFIGVHKDEIQELISSKNSKIDSYLRNCSEIWLIIVADGRHISSNIDLSEETLQHCYSSRFEKVLFYDAFGKNVILLQKRT